MCARIQHTPLEVQWKTLSTGTNDTNGTNGTLYNLPFGAHLIIPMCTYMLHLTLLLACRFKRYGSETDMAAEASRCMRSCGTNNGNNTNGVCMSE